MNKELLKKLPKIDELLNRQNIIKELDKTPRYIVLEALREVVEEFRLEILQKNLKINLDIENIEYIALKKIKIKNRLNLQPVVNGTGIILHTNLGRANLSVNAINALNSISSSYSNLEYNIKTGERGSRYDNIKEILIKLTNAEDVVVVNNNAAAVLLILSAIAKSKNTIISRGELVEIGGHFRIPDIIKESGSNLVEVGTTNKTHLKDYEINIDESAVLLKVHTSNYKIVGFTKEVYLEELVKLGGNYNIPVIYDLGSGTLIDLKKYNIHNEPCVKDCINTGVDILSFSGDKLLGGPQAGIIVGKKNYIDKIKKHPLTRALRVDKLTLVSLEATLKEYLDEETVVKNIPVLNKIASKKEDLHKKAFDLSHKIKELNKNINVSIIEDKGQVGGGSIPNYYIDTFSVSIKPQNISVNLLEEKLRNSLKPIILRIHKESLIINILTVDEKDFDYIAKSINKYIK